jgi:hypothetical protein
MSKLEHQLVNLRHIQHHTGQLADRLRQAADRGLRWVGGASLFLAATLLSAATPARAQQTRDSSAASFDSTGAAAAARPWRDSVRYGGGPSVGAPPSDYTGAAPPSQWCL